MRHLSLIVFALVIMAGAMLASGQDLSTTSIGDQFDSGFRGGDCDAGPAGTFNGDWCDAVSSSNGTVGTVTYRNVFAGQYSKSGEVESPVLDVTASNVSPDRTLTIAGVAANTRPGATSPSNAVFVGDDGGYNALAFGDLASTDYYVSVDCYLPDHTGVAGAGGSNFTRMGLSVRNNYYQEPAVDGPGWIEHTTGSYALLFESSINKLYALKILPQSTGNDTRNTSFETAHPTIQIIGTQVLSGSGWHTLRINVSGTAVRTTVQYLVDDSQIAQLVDTANVYAQGAAVLYYRASGTFDNVAATDTQGRYDNMQAGPYYIAPSTGASDWQLWQ